ncbi:hypothetical protein [Phytoactinopolyspora halotolerans]|uniref:Uncharacterized protein n=1 Tax=Phytoactinopolyspora halotolerans TaxID=1981512 RepID=A0A6L9SBX3_9ACTN|nr:hypothetical protein [Phytoactinopolyspora halotolerans]NEE01510.1 hypothetical protein [Phytoactinopolyspora halotolerans]
MPLVPVALSLLHRSDGAILCNPTIVDINGEHELIGVAQKALEQLGFEYPDIELYYAGVAIGLPTADDDPWSPISRALPVVVEENGRFLWETFRPALTYKQLVTTAESGFCADPGEGISLILTGGYGGLESIDWPLFLHALESTRDHLIVLGAIYGGVSAVRDICTGAKKAFDGGISAIRRLTTHNSPADPLSIALAVDRSIELRLDVVARGLDLSNQDTAALLDVLGFIPTNERHIYTQGATRLCRLNRILYESSARSGAIDQEELKQYLTELRRDIDVLMEEVAKNKSSHLDQPGAPIEHLLGRGWEPPR